MKLKLKSDQIEDYLEESKIINYHHALIQEKVEKLKEQTTSTYDYALMAFNFVRDEIKHSFDIAGTNVTISASETLENREGICFAKAHLLAAFLRAEGIPTGFCYQKVIRKETVDSGYALHGLNAIYLDNRWFRVDPRGNKPGISSEFQMDKEELAYVIHPEKGEEDYFEVFDKPLQNVIQAMKESKDCDELFYKRPEALTE